MINVQQALVNIENDHRASRTNLSLNYGNLSGIENSPTATWNGTITNINWSSETTATWDVTFTRLDGRKGTPICDLGFDYIVPVPDASVFIDESCWRIYLLETGSDYTKFRVSAMLNWLSSKGVKDIPNMSVVVQAISPINGSLSIVRV